MISPVKKSGFDENTCTKVELLYFRQI